RALRRGRRPPGGHSIFSAVAPARSRQLSRRTLRSPATVEAYLQAGMTPRFIERALAIESETMKHRKRLARAYKKMRAVHADDPTGFAERWRATAKRWGFRDVNDLIAEHNNWYPVERRLPLNPRT